MSKFKIFTQTILFLLATNVVLADLEWITGGTPKNTPEKSGQAVVRDAPPEESRPSTLGNQDIVVSHLITCTKILNQYPVDSVNYFYLNKHNQICYYAYFLIKPSSRIHTATVEWYSPNNVRIARFEQEFQVSFVDRLLTIQSETYQWFLVTMNVGIDHVNAEFGQTGLARDLGLYTIHLNVDGQLVGITFFYVKEAESKTPTAVATIPSAPSPSGLPLATPVSKAPITKKIPSQINTPSASNIISH